jgi:hypothetical protein
MYGIYFENQQIATTPRFDVLPSGDLECRKEFGGRVFLTIARGSWDHVAWEGDE